MQIIRNIRLSFLLALISIGIALSCYAQTSEKGFRTPSKDLAQSIGLTEGGTRWALIVGIADYPSSKGAFEIQKLQAPAKDANALFAFLSNPGKGGFNNENIYVLTNEKATKREILMKFNDIAKNASKDDMVIFYFSGHGYRPSENETTFLIPYDYDLDDYETTCINFDDLSRKIQKMQASKVVVILDACHSGGVKPKGSKAMSSQGIVEQYLKEFQKAEGRYLLISSDEKEVSWETSESGVFTKFLIEGLTGKADKDKNGIVTFVEVASFVEEEVPKFTRENFPSIQKPARRGGLEGQMRGDIPLAINEEQWRYSEREKLLEIRKNAIVMAGLDIDLENFSLKVAQSDYENKTLTEQEALLLQKIDALKDKRITSAEYAERAKIIYRTVFGNIPIKKIDTSKPVIPEKTVSSIEQKKPLPDKSTNKGLPRVGLFAVYVKPKEHDGVAGFGINYNFGNLFTHYLRSEAGIEYWKKDHSESGTDEDGEYEYSQDSGFLNANYSIKIYPLDRIVSPFTGLGLTFGFRHYSHYMNHFNSGSENSWTENKFIIGPHFVTGIDAYIHSIIKFSTEFRYTIAWESNFDYTEKSDISPFYEFVGALVFALW